MTQPVSDFPTQPQARPQSQSQSQQMDVDAQPQAPSHSPADMQWQFMGATVSRTAPSSPQEPSVQSDPIPPRDAIRNSRPSYAEAVVNGGRSATTSLPNVQALTDIIHNAQTALNAVVQASQGTLSDTAARSTLVGLAARAEPALRALSAAHAGLAAAQALQPPMTGPCPCAQSPLRDPVPQSELPRGASAWFQDRCIVLDPPNDAHRRRATDIPVMGARLSAALRQALPLPDGRVVDMLRRTAKGGYCAQLPPPWALIFSLAREPSPS